MSQLRVYDPFAVDNLEDWFRSWLRPMRLEAQGTPQIKIEVRETDKDFLIKAQIPGIKKEDIDVKVDGDRVSISAELREQKEEKHNGKVLRSEINYGSSSRAFSLGASVDASKAAARYEAGVLELTLPKKASTESRKLTIQ